MHGVEIRLIMLCALIRLTCDPTVNGYGQMLMEFTDDVGFLCVEWKVW